MDLTKHDPDSEKMLANMDQASYALTQARSIAEIKHVHDIAEAAKRYAKAADLCNEAYVMASVVAADARRKAGEMLSKLEKSEGGRPQKNTAARGAVSEYREVLRDVSLGEQTARRWQQEARVPDDVYQDIKQNALDNGKELSQRNVLKVVKDAEVHQKKNEYEVRIQHTSTDTSVNIFDTDTKYRIIYADPPWSYNDKQEINSLGGASKHYHTMTTDLICGLPINEITDKDAVLFIWVTSPLLEDAFKVINAWGFKYKSSFVWDKIRHNMGHYNSVRHEFLLVATKGSCVPDNKKLFDSVQCIEKSDKHSEKPKEFINIIDTIYTFGDRIELFARKKHADNWHVWGNEV